jgi:pyrroloquinoline-quinone synthase
MRCPSCLEPLDPGAFRELSEHLVRAAAASDSDHVRFLNQNIDRHRRTAEELLPRLRDFFDLGDAPIGSWITRRFISKFYGAVPHPFVAAMQRPSRATLLGYVVEHQHFLRQWVRSCALITARTDEPEVIRYELDNLVTEFGGAPPDVPSHYELLLRMGESYGLSRGRILATPPLPATARSIAGWQRIASELDWVEAMAAMHSLELIAHRGLVELGASMHYFDPALLSGPAITSESQAFLREGYAADVGHAGTALALVDRFARARGKVEEVQATFVRSADLFDDYLMARLERGAGFEG